MQNWVQPELPDYALVLKLIAARIASDAEIQLSRGWDMRATAWNGSDAFHYKGVTRLEGSC